MSSNIWLKIKRYDIVSRSPCLCAPSFSHDSPVLLLCFFYSNHFILCECCIEWSKWKKHPRSREKNMTNILNACVTEIRAYYFWWCVCAIVLSLCLFRFVSLHTALIAKVFWSHHPLTSVNIKNNWIETTQQQYSDRNTKRRNKNED